MWMRYRNIFQWNLHHHGVGRDPRHGLRWMCRGGERVSVLLLMIHSLASEYDFRRLFLSRGQCLRLGRFSGSVVSSKMMGLRGDARQSRTAGGSTMVIRTRHAIEVRGTNNVYLCGGSPEASRSTSQLMTSAEQDGVVIVL